MSGTTTTGETANLYFMLNVLYSELIFQENGTHRKYEINDK